MKNKLAEKVAQKFRERGEAPPKTKKNFKINLPKMKQGC